jgi:hypothetical protein
MIVGDGEETAVISRWSCVEDTIGRHTFKEKLLLELRVEIDGVLRRNE